MNNPQSVLVVGGGVIGLSIGWELIQRGLDVTIIDNNSMGQKASWAGAGILAPANSKTATQPLDKLMGLGSELHEAWHSRLLKETGIDNGFKKCGGIYVAYTAGDKAALAGQQLNWSDYEIDFQSITVDHPAVRSLAVENDWVMLSVPGESQIRNPDHLKALVRANEISGARIIENCKLQHLNFSNNYVESVMTSVGKLSVDHVCFCTGAWSQELLGQIGVQLPLIPVRGQMVLFKLDRAIFDSIINVGSRYIVPREDGHVLVGATLEEVGFDESTTEDEIQELLQFATSVVPALTKDKLVRQWAGLRPATNDGFPFMGKLNGFANVSVATGHFKCGLQMSTAVAVMLADEIQGRSTIMDGRPFAASRLDFENSVEFNSLRPGSDIG